MDDRRQRLVIDGTIPDHTQYFGREVSAVLPNPSTATRRIVDEDDRRILGAYLVRLHADEIINLFALAIRHDLATDDVKSTIFGYPAGASDIGYML